MNPEDRPGYLTDPDGAVRNFIQALYDRVPTIANVSAQYIGDTIEGGVEYEVTIVDTRQQTDYYVVTLTQMADPFWIRLFKQPPAPGGKR